MPAAPDQVRAAVAAVATEAGLALQSATAAAVTSEEIQAALYLAAPLIIADYSDGSSALALDWYEELREAARPRRSFSPQPVRVVTDEQSKAIVAASTVALREAPEVDVPPLASVSYKLIGQKVEKLVVDAFRATVTENTRVDPGAVGWRRLARPDACKFCLMLAARGAVFTAETARFAAHGAEMRGGRKGGNCMCIAGPAFGGREIWEEATPIQYLASRPQRDSYDNERLRDYLNNNFPDAPG